MNFFLCRRITRL